MSQDDGDFTDPASRAGKTAVDYARGFGYQEPIRLLTAR